MPTVSKSVQLTVNKYDILVENLKEFTNVRDAVSLYVGDVETRSIKLWIKMVNGLLSHIESVILATTSSIEFIN